MFQTLQSKNYSNPVKNRWNSKTWAEPRESNSQRKSSKRIGSMVHRDETLKR